jgi:hypothetical protein
MAGVNVYPHFWIPVMFTCYTTLKTSGFHNGINIVSSGLCVTIVLEYCCYN